MRAQRAAIALCLLLAKGKPYTNGRTNFIGVVDGTSISKLGFDPYLPKFGLPPSLPVSLSFFVGSHEARRYVR